MKWFLIEFWHFMTTLNILGVIFGIAIGTWWKRLGSVYIEHISDSDLFSEYELSSGKKESEYTVIVNIFNQKGVAVFITKFDLEQNGKCYKVRRKTGRGIELDILKIDASSAKTIVLLCETVPQKGDIVRATMHKRRKPIMFKIK